MKKIAQQLIQKYILERKIIKELIKNAAYSAAFFQTNNKPSYEYSLQPTEI